MAVTGEIPDGRGRQHSGGCGRSKCLKSASGFFSIVSVLNNRPQLAAYAIVLAALLDGFDGRVARWTRSTSEFGVQYDSLCDLVSFGLAPALFVYVWVLKPYGRVGWLAAFLFILCGALRLARFNVLSADPKRVDYVGLPIPAAALVVASTALFTFHVGSFYRMPPLVVVSLVYTLGFLMVSNLRYRSYKRARFAGRKPFGVLVFAVLLLYIVLSVPQVMLLVLSGAYALSGPAEFVYARLKRKVALPASRTEP
ncbi:MAG: CDP-diacylglycerol--serine O-phosphatidyltransferase [Candidatus Tectomicrobia bacterium]|uniref:CDP-diacylglycerol--serine O-phosphatidyltransferase n=1 Tax=Tectimicrobiota bacterium TaxID=2528274 RepID=A0A932GQW8_UNCTE|nr:CDP-diacylglycerol--serine O-phosphatidyltransferase [Candidatus Tectomicrobia bacterium]